MERKPWARNSCRDKGINGKYEGCIWKPNTEAFLFAGDICINPSRGAFLIADGQTSWQEDRETFMQALIKHLGINEIENSYGQLPNHRVNSGPTNYKI
jgi:hypothetical protein